MNNFNEINFSIGCMVLPWISLSVCQDIVGLLMRLCSKCQIHAGDFVNFCGLLRKHKLYPTTLIIYNSLHSLNRNLAFLISVSVTVFWKGHTNLILSKNLAYKISDIIFKDVSLTKRAPAWKFFHSNEKNKLSKCQ